MSLSQIEIMSNVIKAFLLSLSIKLHLLETEALVMVVVEKPFRAFSLWRTLLASCLAPDLFDFSGFSLRGNIKGRGRGTFIF